MIDTFQFYSKTSLTIIPPISIQSTTHRKSIITSAKSKPFFGSQRSRKTLIQFARFAASNLHHVFPAPFNSVIREIGFSGDGGSSGGGGWNGFRWGGFDGGGGGGRKRRVNKKSQFWVLGFVGFCCVLGVILSGDLKLRNDVLVLGGMCVSMFMVLVRNGCVSDWVLGFCCGGVIVGLAVNKKDNFNKLVKRFKAENRIARYIKMIKYNGIKGLSRF